MALITVPDNFIPTDEFTADYANQIVKALKTGEYDIAAANITSAGDAVATEVSVGSLLDGYVGHGLYEGARTESTYITIPENSAPIKLTLNSIVSQEESLNTTQGTTSFWDISGEIVQILASKGEGHLRVTFKVWPDKRDTIFGLAAVLPTPTPVTLTSETRSVGKEDRQWRTVSFNVPFFISQSIRDYGIELYITNDEPAGGQGFIRVCEETVMIQQIGGSL